MILLHWKVWVLCDPRRLYRDKHIFPSLKSVGPVGPTWAGLCSQKPRPVKVKADNGSLLLRIYRKRVPH